ncbi:MAG: roadblock/LC7 domain-containing protein [Dichotomicrobium sp.]
MSTDLTPLVELPGFIAAAVVDSESGMILASETRGNFDIELASAGNTEVVRAKRRTLTSLKLSDKIEDILISLDRQYHLIRLLNANERAFIYLAMDRGMANLAMARMTMERVDANTTV